MRYVNPLRYPGSKQRFIPYLVYFVEKNYLAGSNICEPFAGSATISLGLLRKNIVSRALLIERDPLVFCFWKALFDHADELCEMIRTADVTMESWLRWSEYRQHEYPLADRIVEIGFAGLFLNRTNYSGIVGAKPIGGMSQSSMYAINCRFNKEDLINRVKALTGLAGRIQIEFGDGIEAIKNIKNARGDWFIYADPPYHTYGQKFYRHWYNDFEHKRLRDTLAATDLPWLLSYDSSRVIVGLYRNFEVRKVLWYHTARRFSVGNELLISNRRLPGLEVVGAADGPEDSGTAATAPGSSRDS